MSQQSASDYVIRLKALRTGLRDSGYVEGRNLAIDYRWAEGNHERLLDLATELVRSKVDLIVTSGTPSTRAATQATATIPIVMASSGDAVATGLVESLARPGGNVTGSTFLTPELSVKRLELLKETLPRIHQVAYLSNPNNATSGVVLRAMEAAAALLKVGLQRPYARSSMELPAIFAEIGERGVEAVVVGQDAMLTSNYAAIAELAARQRIPSSGAAEFGEVGGLFGYGHDVLEMWRRTALYIDKILKGARPADLPVEQPTKFELVVNMKTAKVLDVRIPDSVLQRGGRLVE